jgi:AcrR family transcriptional regulator
MPRKESPENAAERRQQMLHAAAALIAARGFGETRIADVAREAKVSPGLVVYYFGSKDKLLVEALRYSDEMFYTTGETLIWQQPTLAARLETLVELTFRSETATELHGAWGLWLDLWAQAYRHPEVAEGRIELDARWRRLIADVVRDGWRNGEIAKVDEQRFAATFGALLDGLAIQVALDDPEIDAAAATEIATDFARGTLGLSGRARKAPARRAPARR